MLKKFTKTCLLTSLLLLMSNLSNATKNTANLQVIDAEIYRAEPSDDEDNPDPLLYPELSDYVGDELNAICAGRAMVGADKPGECTIKNEEIWLNKNLRGANILFGKNYRFQYTTWEHATLFIKHNCQVKYKNQFSNKIVKFKPEDVEDAIDYNTQKTLRCGKRAGVDDENENRKLAS